MFLFRSKTMQPNLISNALLALIVAALETWLRVPVGPLFEGYIQAVIFRAQALLRRISVRTFIQEVLC